MFSINQEKAYVIAIHVFVVNCARRLNQLYVRFVSIQLIPLRFMKW